ncbi:hypothetical protein AAJ76_800073758 [Vairimorpha ceranae]|uniref:Uncharacterized protein n=1 Tax=Vairimorpha ceranae TaxID=40302 RepID=A0A0F9WT66_9MICR|nr:hypothetical protein AAJ76_800073758 [Vairimorpha ceranae]KKO76013.1 hypothetical protein AAJ76_800073758 [Vairimorpha ceranae]
MLTNKEIEDIQKELESYNSIILEYKNNLVKSLNLLKRFKDKFKK